MAPDLSVWVPAKRAMPQLDGRVSSKMERKLILGAKEASPERITQFKRVACGRESKRHAEAVLSRQSPAARLQEIAHANSRKGNG